MNAETTDKEITFEFVRKPPYSIYGLTEHYSEIFNKYFKEVYKVQENVKVIHENLSYSNPHYENGKLRTCDYSNILSLIMPYTANYRISATYSKGFLFEFFIYNQNNCCGAMSTSMTRVSVRGRGIGKILQHLKEDIAILENASLLTCTDVYFEKYKYIDEGTMYNLTPYLNNTKLLLNTGWNISKLFWNENSKNVVGLFTKNVSKFRENKIIKMKIREEENLVKIENVTVGCDPELFFRSKDTGEFVASFSVIKGDKNNPTVISEQGHNIQCDNVMVEYGVPASRTAEEFVNNNMFVQNYLKDKVAEAKRLELVIFPFVNFPDNELKSDRAQAFGCDPDFDVWNGGRPNEVGRAGSNGRCAGGHIHIGYNNHNRVTSNYIIKALDLFVSTPLVLMEPDNRRKEMYGKAGSYRPQPWGVEYRSTSNYIFSTPELMAWAFEQVQRAIEFVNDDNNRKQLDIKASHITRAINDKDKNYAKNLIETFNLTVLETVLTN